MKRERSLEKKRLNSVHVDLVWVVEGSEVDQKWNHRANSCHLLGFKLSPYERFVESLAPRISEGDLIGNRVTADIKVRSYWSRVGPQSNMTDVLIREENAM